nr:hypothetical protein CFP56_59602 [Quercus suber]
MVKSKVVRKGRTLKLMSYVPTSRRADPTSTLYNPSPTYINEEVRPLEIHVVMSCLLRSMFVTRSATNTHVRHFHDDGTWKQELRMDGDELDLYHGRMNLLDGTLRSFIPDLFFCGNCPLSYPKQNSCNARLERSAFMTHLGGGKYCQSNSSHLWFIWFIEIMCHGGNHEFVPAVKHVPTISSL